MPDNNWMPHVEWGASEPQKITYDFSGLKTTNNRPYDADSLNYIGSKLSEHGYDDLHIAAILGTIAEESGGDPYAVSDDGSFQGLMQWAGDRYSINPFMIEDRQREMDRQLEYIINTIDNTTDQKSWTHGGEGSGYKRAVDAHDAWVNGTELGPLVHALNRGYVRPTGKDNSVKNRLNVSQQIYGRITAPRPPESIRKPSNMYADGGRLKQSINTAIKNIDATLKAYDDPRRIEQQSLNSMSSFNGFGGGRYGGAGARGEWLEMPFDKLADYNATDINNSLFVGPYMDYVRNTPAYVEQNGRSFSSAYAKARMAGLDTFEFDGKLYNTEYNANGKAVPERYEHINVPIILREVLTGNEEPIQDSTEVLPFPLLKNGERFGKERRINGVPEHMYADGGHKIHIKPENRGKFTALKERTGHSATWFKENGTPAQRKMATFALNSRHWSHKHNDGGRLK